MSAPSREQGFTLIEVMIALLIFGLIAAAAGVMLSFSVRAQQRTIARLDDIGAVARMGALLNSDLAQATDRPTRETDGQQTPAFSGGADGAAVPALRLVRGGWANLDGDLRPSLQRVEYQLRDGQLLRVTYPMLDGAAPAEPLVVLGNVASLAIQYRINGSWVDQWDDAMRRVAPLPDALAIDVTRGDGRRYRQSFIVGTGYHPKANAAANGDAR